MEPRLGDAPTNVLRIWRAFGLQPWRTEDFWRTWAEISCAA
ncbi:hypothetical protein OG729_01430 [Streptomyces sp. NBC_00210]